MSKQTHEIVPTWKYMHKYSPAPRYRRRLLLKYLREIEFNNCLEVGCAQGYLIQAITDLFKVKGYGCDISSVMICENKKQMTACEYLVLDIEKETWPNEEKFDVVISSEVIEHIFDWKSAVRHLTLMTKSHLLITVPGGRIRHIDKKVGHLQHFQGNEIKKEIEAYGFHCEVKRVGFPIHSCYKRLINWLLPDKIYENFAGEKSYSFIQKCISGFLHYLFYLNDFFKGGEQLIIIAKRI